jgi:ubiquinone biosynthesis monooxygenase Coq7
VGRGARQLVDARMTKLTADDRLPGDPDKKTLVDQIIRVDQAGEYGAKRIYEGQIAVLGATAAGPVLRTMLAQEEEHLKRFNGIMAARGTRPTALQPLWHVAGYALGAATALLGKEAAMACTVAVEDVIGEHYREQAEQLGDDEKDLRETISAFREDELHHKKVSLDEGAEAAPGYEALTAAVKTGTRIAIWLAKRF